jgi:hypothetical protein
VESDRIAAQIGCSGLARPTWRIRAVSESPKQSGVCRAGANPSPIVLLHRKDFHECFNSVDIAPPHNRLRIDLLFLSTGVMNPMTATRSGETNEHQIRSPTKVFEKFGSPVWIRFELLRLGWPSDRTLRRPSFSERFERTADACPWWAPSLGMSRTRQCSPADFRSRHPAVNRVDTSRVSACAR